MGTAYIANKLVYIKKKSERNYNTIFRQILNMIPRRQFGYESSKGGYNKYTKHFTRVIKEALFKKMGIIDILNINPNKIKQAREPCK